MKKKYRLYEIFPDDDYQDSYYIIQEEDEELDKYDLRKTSSGDIDMGMWGNCITEIEPSTGEVIRKGYLDSEYVAIGMWAFGSIVWDEDV